MSLGQLGTLLSNVSQLSPADADIIETTDPSSNRSGISSSGTTEHAAESPAAEDSSSESAYDVWVSAILSSVQSQLNSSSTHGSSSSSTKLPTSTAITQLVWGVSEMRIDPGGPLLAELWAILEPQLQDLLGSDLATLTCGLGIIVVETGRPLQPPQPPASSSASPAEQLQQHRQRWVQVLGTEAEYQLKQFPTDFDAFSLARLVSGLAGLGFDPEAGFRTILMRAVYPSMKTIEEKAAVDFALAKFGKVSMKYDTRWTFAEMHWLPGHERDKRRIMKENWVKTQWTGSKY
ncbi:MAG: hypothetical protein WDW38_000775 [Sanguina aurantia]